MGYDVVKSLWVKGSYFITSKINIDSATSTRSMALDHQRIISAVHVSSLSSVKWVIRQRRLIYMNHTDLTIDPFPYQLVIHITNLRPFLIYSIHSDLPLNLRSSSSTTTPRTCLRRLTLKIFPASQYSL